MTRPARSLDELIDDLAGPDLNGRSRALALVLAHGRAALPGLLRTLGHADAEVRVLAAGGLAHLADPSCADTFAGMLADPDERIRAQGACGLARLHDPRALDALIQTLDDDPDPLRHPTSP
ncbi:MAG TPA: HEAT repeat domain-containing protein, partial [Kofleriaceae bacterium]